MRLLSPLLLLLLLTSCTSLFDSTEYAVARLEQEAQDSRQFDYHIGKIDYLFVDNPHAECLARGVVLARYLKTGQTLNTVKIGACAVLGDPCLVILPFMPTKEIVREEQLHCRYGDWHLIQARYP